MGVLLYIGYKQFILKPKIEEAQQQVFVAQEYFAQDSLQLALQGDGNYPGFLAIADNYSGTPTGNLAHYYIGVIYLQQGRYQEALDYLEEFETDSYLLTPMRLGAMGNAHAQLGAYQKAADFFKRAAQANPNDLTSPRFLYKAGMMLEQANQLEDAQATLEQLRRDYRNSRYAREALKLIGRIEAQLSNTAS